MRSTFASNHDYIDAADPAAMLNIDIGRDIRSEGAAHDMGADEAG